MQIKSSKNCNWLVLVVFWSGYHCNPTIHRRMEAFQQCRQRLSCTFLIVYGSHIRMIRTKQIYSGTSQQFLSIVVIRGAHIGCPIKIMLLKFSINFICHTTFKFQQDFKIFLTNRNFFDEGMLEVIISST